jgi:hypothetical protein
LSSLFEIFESKADSLVVDINIVPMSITYDMKIEEKFELDCTKETHGYSAFQWLKFLWKLFLSGNQNCGRARVDFDQPFSLLEFRQTNQEKITSSRETSKEAVSDAENFTIMLNNHVLWNNYNLRRFATSDIYSFVMLNKPKPDAVDSFDRVTSDIKAMCLMSLCLMNHQIILWVGYVTIYG